MNKEKTALLWPLLGMAFAACALALCVVTMFQQEDSFAIVIAVTIAGLIVACGCAFIKKISFLSAFVPALYFLAGLMFLVTQFSNIGYALYNVNIGDGIMPTFVISFVLYLLAAVVATISSFKSKE